MAGCGIRAMRWELESAATEGVPVQLHVNDAGVDRRDLLEASSTVRDRSSNANKP